VRLYRKVRNNSLLRLRLPLNRLVKAIVNLVKTEVAVEVHAYPYLSNNKSRFRKVKALKVDVAVNVKAVRNRVLIRYPITS
jgi:hypothetical protein